MPSAKRRLAVTTAGMLMATAACGSGGSGGSAQYTIKYSTQWAKGYPAVQADQYFADEVNKESNGKIKVKLYLNGELGGASGTLKGVQSGSIQMGVVATSWLTDAVPKYGAISLPYLFSSPDQANSVLNSGPAGKQLAGETEKKIGIQIMGWYYTGFGEVSTTNKMVRTPSDLKGQKIRTLSNPIEEATYKGYGASVVPLSNTETFSGLQSGVVHGVTIPTLAEISDKYNEVCKYTTLTNDEAFESVTMVNEAYFKKLPANLQKIVTSVGKKAAAKEEAFYKSADQGGIAKLKQSGTKVTTPTAGQLAQFKATTKASYTLAAKKYGTDFINLLKR